MAVLHQKISLNRIKVVVVGESEVGKTSLIRTFKEGVFREEWDASDDVETKLVDECGEKLLFQMVELHLDEKLKTLPEHAAKAKAVLLLYEDETKETIDSIKNKWYSLVNLHFSRIPLILVRSKVDKHGDAITSLGRHLAAEVHAIHFVECSTKREKSIAGVFLQTAAALKKLEKRKKQEHSNDPTNAQSTLGCWAGMAYNSVPLIKQSFRNVREIVRNPQAFTEQKRALEYFVPVLDFNLPPEKKENSENESDKDSSDA